MPDQEPLSPRRQQILQAAVVVLAAQGWRGVTRRAIGREGDLPESSSSAYYRSRSALQDAMAGYVMGRITDDVHGLADAIAQRPGDHQHAVAATSALFRRWLRECDLLTARLELTLASARDAALAKVIDDARLALLEVIDEVLARSGKVHTERESVTILAALDGVLISALRRPRTEQSRMVDEAIDLLLGSLADAPESA